MPTARVETGSVTTLHGASFDFYEEVRRATGNEHLRMTYYDGTLEIMSPLYLHEKYSWRLGLLILAVTAILQIPCLSTGSTTFKRKGRQPRRGSGREPGQSFYLANESPVRGKDEIDLEVDPPPDLWIEVDHRGGSRGRLPLYAALGVPEVWRFRSRTKRLWFGRLEGDKYVQIVQSLSLPMLTPERVLEALSLGEGLSDSEWDPLLRAWIAAHLLRAS
ncbi:MAG: Uma2 family endonuclease [Isosphaeraceae bacterium]